jgi:hypothetical protein
LELRASGPLNQPVIEALRAGRIQGEGSVVYAVPTKLEPLQFMHLEIVKNKIELKKLWPLKIKDSKIQKKQTIEHYKGQFSNTQFFKNMLFCCY